MAIYICKECGKHKDDDHEPMEDNELCPDCFNDNACCYCEEPLNGGYSLMDGDKYHSECLLKELDSIGMDQDFNA